ncbi:uncharacterized protein [Ptychodera flava]|uniref:uncharacterized protein n=1 Tax=Ptychodera flava TaxID=63121 RepID=UPI00396A0F95
MAVQTAVVCSVVLTVFLLSSHEGLVEGNSDFEVITEDALSCYDCRGYDSSSIDRCLNNPASVSTKEVCPTEVAGTQVFPSCHKTKQTAAGKITSVTRGCLYHYNCTEITSCLNNNETGVCVNCCNDVDLCNTASTSQNVQLVVMATSLSLFIAATRLVCAQ